MGHVSKRRNSQLESAGEHGCDPTLTITFNEDLNTAAPATNRFTYKAGGTIQRSVDGIAISGNQVTLTWNAAVSTTGTLTLDYTKPGDTANPLQDAAGNKVASFTGQTNTHLKDAFNVRVEGANHSPTGASTADYGYQVRLTMAPGFSAYGCPKMSVHYDGGVLVDPGDDERREVNSFGLYSSGNCVTPKPNAKWISGTSVVVNMDKAVTLDTARYPNAGDAAGFFTVNINRRGYKPVGVYVDGRNIRLDMGDRLHPIVERWGLQSWPETVTKLSIDYEPPTGMSNKPLYDAATGEPLLGFGIY